MPNELDRPAVLTEDVQRQIVDYVGRGNYLTTACAAAGTTVETVNYWRRLYESGAEHAQVYADFFIALSRASALAEINSVDAVTSGRMGWQGPAHFLERRFYKRWGRKEREKQVAISVTPGQPKRINLRDNRPRRDDGKPPAGDGS